MNMMETSRVTRFRSSKDDFSTVVGRCIIPKDPHPQWRHLAWSPDGDTVVCSSSCGHVELFDLVGSPICTIASVSLESVSDVIVYE